MPFIIIILPLLITTLILLAQARWGWMRTMDKILRGMQLDEVKKRVDRAGWHRTLAKRHAVGVATVFLIGLLLAYLLPYSDYASIPSFSLLWAYIFLIPHLIALYLYHVRWNPLTLERKRKLDAEDVVYEGDFSLKRNAQYGIDEEGELIELAAAEAAERLQQEEEQTIS